VPLDLRRMADGEDGFGAALAHALRHSGDVGGAPDGSLNQWAADRVTSVDLPDGAPLIAPSRSVTVDALTRAGTALSEAQRMRAVLEGGALAAGEVDLTAAQQFRLALALDAHAAPVAWVTAAVVARELGVAVVLVGPDGGLHRFGPAAIAPLVVVEEAGGFLAGVPRARRS
jgi:hypothetical protein